MDKDLLYRFFEGRASVEEMRLVKEWSEASGGEQQAVTSGAQAVQCHHSFGALRII